MTQANRQGCIPMLLKAMWHTLCREWGQGFEFSWVKGSVPSLLNHRQLHVDNRDILVFFGGIIKIIHMLEDG